MKTKKILASQHCPAYEFLKKFILLRVFDNIKRIDHHFLKYGRVAKFIYLFPTLRTSRDTLDFTMAISAS